MKLIIDNFAKIKKQKLFLMESLLLRERIILEKVRWEKYSMGFLIL